MSTSSSRTSASSVERLVGLSAWSMRDLLVAEARQPPVAGGPPPSNAAALQLQRAHPMRLGERPSVGVAELDDVAEYLVERTGVALLLARRPAGQTLQLGEQRLELGVRLPAHQAEPAGQLPRLAGRGPVQVAVPLERGTDGAGRVVYGRMQLSGALFQRAHRLLQPLSRRLQPELAQPLLDRGLAPLLVLFGLEAAPQALFLGPELLLDEPLARLPPALLEPQGGLRRLQLTALLAGPALLGQHLAPEQEHADAVAQHEPVAQVLRARHRPEHATHDPVLEALRDRVAGRLQPAGRVGGQPQERLDHLLAHRLVLLEGHGARRLERALGRLELALERLEGPPRHPAVRRRLEQG